jgi:hypothetical protein
VDRFFDGYDKAFILPDEREEIEGFRECLALNGSYRYAFGRTQCELVATICDSDGELLAGANFLSTSLGEDRFATRVSVALNYVFVVPQARGRKLLHRALDAVRWLAPLSVASQAAPAEVAIFIEQNDPFRMTDEAYRLDTEHSGLDQIARLAIWHRMGARIVDFPYVQPALSADQKPDDGLVYAAVAFPGDTVPAALLHDHFESFFGISVLKGDDPASDPTARAQLAELANRASGVALLNIGEALLDLAGVVPAATGAPTLRAYLHGR